MPRNEQLYNCNIYIYVCVSITGDVRYLAKHAYALASSHKFLPTFISVFDYFPPFSVNVPEDNMKAPMIFLLVI